ncbi:Putative NmrA-like domain, NAD(P)-binding domain superfamily [Septoria linicola]|uniref:NmrA-like domain, NAD(P)-binding domain superfamily n=1 Tax=Septoria linicola TaxID=215465 RepID=A0A9Q9AR54_9PEZI|nr:putative NmrA-like domain, NAD(P)-binding domain superfamily [Septoria linicola]USW49286.1 Putative NmrA-like domain, NAD(P)-binding domain superfamily [Septoria linicola]
MPADLKLVFIVGGTGAQGLPVVKSLSDSGSYRVRILTRNKNSERAKQISQWPNVELVEGQQTSQKDLHEGFKGAWGAWVNTDGFTIGEKNELFYGIRAYEIARHEGVQHYIYASTDFALQDMNWDENYHWGHNDAKGRVLDFIKAQGQKGMTSSSVITGPYMDMLYDGMFVPQEQEDGSLAWVNPADTGKIPLINLEDGGPYALWMFNNVEESAGLFLKVATDEVSFEDIAKTFTEVTGKKASHIRVPLADFLAKAEPWPNAPANFAAGPNGHRDESSMTFIENFTPWWKYWGEGRAEKRDFALLDKIHPGRVKSLREWMEKYKYDGQPKSVLKGLKDLKDAKAAMEATQSK